LPGQPAVGALARQPGFTPPGSPVRPPPPPARRRHGRWPAAPSSSKRRSWSLAWSVPGNPLSGP
jgi:hypothetical protein